MLAQINMQLEEQKIDNNMSSLFHGYLMQKIDPAYADYLHHNRTNPFTSCVYKDKYSSKYNWRITAYNKKAYDMIISKFIDNMPQSIYIEHKDMDIRVISSDIKQTSFEELFLKAKKNNKITLLSPTSYKTAEKTQIFPNIKTLLKGVIEKINLHSDSIKLSDEKIINELIDNVYIKDYNLRTSLFHLEKIKIKGFIGTMNLSVKKDETLEQLLNFLTSSSEYIGFGIKTSLGMGGIKIE